MPVTLSPPRVVPAEVFHDEAIEGRRPRQLELHGGNAHGKVVKKVTKAMTIKGHKVAASEDNPEYLVETEEGKQAAHKEQALTKL